MPIYEYECPACCNVFEIFQRMTEEPLPVCPECAGPVKKLVSVSSFQLKGGGWYADGYSSKPGNGSASTAKDAKGEKSGTATAATTEKGKAAKDTTKAPKTTAAAKSCNKAA